MTLETYKEIHANDPVAKLVYLMTDEAYYISCDARSAGWCDANNDAGGEKWYRDQVEHHKMRVGWLYDTIVKKLREVERDD